MQPNSFNRANGLSVGGSVFLDNGFVGINYQQFNSIYHIPGRDSAATNTRLDVRQQKVSTKGELRFSSGFMESVRFWFGVTNYKHDEIGLNDDNIDGIRATFKNREVESRVEAKHVPIETAFGTLRGAAGVSFSNASLSASGEAGGLISPAQTRSAATYLFKELQINPAIKMQAAARIESVRVAGTASQFPANTIPDGSDPIKFSKVRSFLPKSFSFGVLHQLPFDMVAGTMRNM